MNPLVRDLYKRVLAVGRDYPTGLDHVRAVWKKALRNRNNCPACYPTEGNAVNALASEACQEEILRAVHRGRHMVKEMIGVIQLKKYRAMKERYDTTSLHAHENHERIMQAAVEFLPRKSDMTSKQATWRDQQIT